MAEMLKRTSPAVGPRPWLAPLPATTRYSLRGGADARAAVAAAFGVEPPTQACRAATNGARAALWLGPDEHLLIAAESDAATLATALPAALAGIPHSLVDVSHRQVAFEVRGPHAEWLLAHGCPLDLAETAFPVGMCTRTVFVKAEILLWRTAADRFRIETWRSFTDYVITLLAETALELPA